MGSTPFPTLIHPVTFTVDSININIKLSNPVLSISNGLDTAHSSSGLPSLPLIKEKVKIHLRLPGHDILAIVTTASME